MPAWLSNLVLRLRSLLGAGTANAAAEVDEELREAFLAELGELIATATAALDALRATPSDATSARTLGRCLHTLKGSAPLVGAPALANLGRAGEYLMQRVAERRTISVRQLQAIEQAVSLLPAWRDALRHGRAAPAGTGQAIAQLGRAAG